MSMVKLNIVQMLGNAEGESTFFTLSFLKSKLRNHLPTIHLDFCAHLFSRPFLRLQTFLYHEAIEDWEQMRIQMEGKLKVVQILGGLPSCCPALVFSVTMLFFVIIWHAKRIWWAF